MRQTMTIEDKLQEILFEIREIKNRIIYRNEERLINTDPECPKLIPARRWNKYQKFPTQGSINGLLLDRRDNGFDKCVVKINKRLYIDRDLYQQWVKEQNLGKSNPDYFKEQLKWKK